MEGIENICWHALLRWSFMFTIFLHYLFHVL